jgi:uncharacterized membrane protein YphA (DoxX/SURF4 family)
MLANTLTLGSFLRSLVVTVALLVVVAALGLGIGSGLALLGVVLWTLTLGLIAAGLFAATRGRVLAGIGAIVTAISVPLAYQYELPAALWTVLFFVGIALIVRGTAADTTNRAAWPILLPRIAVGWGLIDNSQDHFRTNWLPALQGTGYLQTATGAANRPPAYALDPLYQSFLKGVVVPNVDVFAGLTICGEMAFGVLLAVGLFTPIASLGAMWLHLNYMNMKSFTNHGGYVDKVFFLSELFNLATNSGQVYGLDATLSRVVPVPIGQALMGLPTSEDVPTLRARPA